MPTVDTLARLFMHVVAGLLIGLAIGATIVCERIRRRRRAEQIAAAEAEHNERLNAIAAILRRGSSPEPYRGRAFRRGDRLREGRPADPERRRPPGNS